MDDGYTVNNINEHYGIISTAPNKIPKGKLMQKLGMPGGAFFARSLDPEMSIVEVTANVSSDGVIRLRASVYESGREYFSGSPEQKIDYLYSSKLTNYYENAIKERLSKK